MGKGKEEKRVNKTKLFREGYWNSMKGDRPNFMNDDKIRNHAGHCGKERV